MVKLGHLNARRTRWLFYRACGGVVLATALVSCSSAPPPLAIRMYNPKTNQTLHCTARSESSAHAPALASAAEACARQLEANGFVRDQ
jgi:hypothetical protein